MRIAIIGAPRAGKTTLAQELARTTGWSILHADDMIPLGWSAASDVLADALGVHDHLIVEGVAVVRALRKALATRTCAPVERCIVLERPRVRFTHGQRVMARGCATVLAKIEPELVRRGVCMERPA